MIHENVSPLISTSINTYNLFVLTGYALQKWSLCVGEQEKLIYECNLELLIAENFEQTVWVCLTQYISIFFIIIF